MTKTTLPVILLRGIALLPNNYLKLELDDNTSKCTIELAMHLHQQTVLFVSLKNALEEHINIKELPKIGIKAKIVSNIELPNGKFRVECKGLERVLIDNYFSQNDDLLDAMVVKLDQSSIEEEIDLALSIKLKKEINKYIKLVPIASNSLLSVTEKDNKIDILTDKIVPHLNLDFARKLEYVECYDPLKRVEMILSDIYHDEESYLIEQRIDLKVQKEMEKREKEYFLKEKLKCIQGELGELSLRDNEVDKLKGKVNLLQCSTRIRDKINFEISRYSSLPETSPELGMVRNYIDFLLQLPWDYKRTEEQNLNKVKEKLDSTHYGLEEVKSRIIEYLVVGKQTNNLTNPILCLVGPPGVGKTTLASSIADSLNRSFVKISVGGISDEAEIRGHRRTYLGANAGKIIDGIKRAKSSNPVFLIDEIDKIHAGINGDPASALLEVFDSEQNRSFRDNYVDIDYDLSNVMFILTANDINAIPAPLKDRLEIIYLSGYTEYEKLDMTHHYLLPNSCIQNGLEQIKMTDDAILEIIRYYTKEAGVRELSRQLSKIVRKIVTENLLTNKQLKERIYIDDLEQYLGKRNYISIINKPNIIGTVNALAYTPFGGEVLTIEVDYYKGEGNLILTGSLGDIMKESAMIALSYIKANAKQFKIDYNLLIKNDIHIHIPSGATLKDGPSAGVSLTTALISAFTETKIDHRIAMTGEITLHGEILPVGGIREKCIGAIRNRMNQILIPKGNMREIDDLPKEIKEQLHFITVDNYQEIYDYLLKSS